MTTAAERLVALAGHGGTAGALLLEIGAGSTTGAALVAYSGLVSGSAAQHLLTDVSAPDQVQRTETIGGRRRLDDQDDIRRRLDVWDEIAAANADSSAVPNRGDEAPGIRPAIAPESSSGKDSIGSTTIAVAAAPAVATTFESGAPLLPDAAAAARLARQQQNNDALIAILLAALD